METNTSNEKLHSESLIVVARRQRNLLYILVVYFLMAGGSAALPAEIKPVSQMLSIVMFVVAGVFNVRLAWCLFGKVGAIFTSIFSFVPVINLIALLVSISRATKILKKNGYRVGLLGANVNEIANQI